MKIRINNIECRPTKDSNRWEIVKWYSNPHYGSENNLIKEGYEKIISEDGDWRYTNKNVSIHSSCFKNPETCYVVTFLDYSKGESDVYLRSVGSRILELNEDELKDFMEVYRIANKKIIVNYES